MNKNYQKPIQEVCELHVDPLLETVSGYDDDDSAKAKGRGYEDDWEVFGD